MSLTKKQKGILDYVSGFLDRHGYSPTLEEIATHFHLASLNGVYKHLQALQERGFIRRLPNQARSIQASEPGKFFAHHSAPSGATLPRVSRWKQW